MVEALENDDDQALLALTGQEAKPADNELAKLAINYETETDDGHTLRKGDYRVWHENRFLYAPEVKIRIFIRSFMWSLFDAEEGKPICNSVQKLSLDGVFNDTLGGNRCGRLVKEEAAKLTDDDPRLVTSKAVQCNQVIYGVLSGKMKEADGTQVQLDNLPIISYFKKSGYMPMNNFIRGLADRKKIIPRVEVNLKTSKAKKGSVTFFVPVPTEGKSLTSLSDEDKILIRMFKDTIDASNVNVMQKHNEVLRGNVSDEDSDLSKDFDAAIT
tara:strand:+ start:249 stop:1061 length:813 start_codon:yes stop_codon:yes gene_type:complete